MAEIVQAPAPGTPTESHSNVTGTALRDSFRSWPTGVAVISGYDGRLPLGMTCNSLTSVSLEPPLLGICVANSSATWPQIRSSGKFCVSVLAHDQEQAGRDFASRDPDRFRDARWHPRESGPALTDALAWFDCSILNEMPAGDHAVVLALVRDVEVSRDGQRPLVFHGGRFLAIPTP